MEAELHNLFPARSGTNRPRSDRTYGDVPGEPREFGTTCDFEVDTDNDVAEPPPDAGGDMARNLTMPRGILGTSLRNSESVPHASRRDNEIVFWPLIEIKSALN